MPADVGPGQLVPGQQFGQYRIVGEIGRGASATVYRAYQANLDRHVALKVAHKREEDPQALERFRREARTAAQLRHPNIVRVYDLGEQDELLYIAMELIEGTTLRSRMGAALPPSFVVPVIAQVAAALDFAHARGVVHRDVKPSNILMEGNQALLTDFGIARTLGGSGLTRAGTSFGTPSSMSPEQAAAEPVGPASDIYSLGVLAYHLLTGHLPFEADHDLALLQAHISKPPPRANVVNPALGEEFADVLERALAKSPTARYPTATAFAEALENAISPLESTANYRAVRREGNGARPAEWAGQTEKRPVASVPPDQREAAPAGPDAGETQAATRTSDRLRSLRGAGTTVRRWAAGEDLASRPGTDGQAEAPTIPASPAGPQAAGRRFGWLALLAGLVVVGLGVVVTLGLASSPWRPAPAYSPQAQTVGNAITEAGASTVATTSQASAASSTSGSGAASAAPRTLIDERFANNQRGWANNPQGMAWVAEDGYHLMARQSGHFVPVGAPVPTLNSNFDVAATYRKLSGGPGGGFGIMVFVQAPASHDGVNQGGRYYVLESGDKGEFGVWRREEGHWVDIVPWTPTSSINKGNATNEILVRVRDKHMAFVINGATVAQNLESSLPPGGAGVYLGGDLNQVLVERFTIREAK